MEQTEVLSKVSHHIKVKFYNIFYKYYDTLLCLNLRVIYKGVLIFIDLHFQRNGEVQNHHSFLWLLFLVW